MDATDYEALAARAFDEPYDAELRAAIRVCGDALERAGDPRGPMIALEHALLDAESPRRARELRRAITAYALEHRDALLGPIAAPTNFTEEIELEWRAGRIYGAAVDARYLSRMDAMIGPAGLVDLALQAPAAHDLRRLRVRVAREHHDEILTMLRRRARRPPLEELEIGGGLWPRTIHARGRWWQLAPEYPNLYLFALGEVIHSLPDVDGIPPKYRAAELQTLDPPTEPRARAILGRVLCSSDEPIRAAALERIAAIGPAARGFAHVMTLLLHPEVAAPQRPIIEAMRALGPSRELARVLARVASRAHRYDVETRRAAGAAAEAIRRALGAG